MLFNVEKCKVVHFGRKNPCEKYSLSGTDLQVVDEERDLGVIVQNDLKVSLQCTKVVNTANRVLGMIYRSFTSRSKDILLLLYKSLVRPHLEYCVQAWRPHLVKDISIIEKVQRRATRMIDGFRALSYEQRLSELNLTTLETRRLRGDLLEVFKIMKGFDNVNADDLFSRVTNDLRGHSFKLFKHRFVTNIGKYSFANRIIDEWNLLPEDIVSCNTVNMFKNKLDHYLRCCRGLI
jgi:ribonuclease P/MRP protein subunit RPP40